MLIKSGTAAGEGRLILLTRNSCCRFHRLLSVWVHQISENEHFPVCTHFSLLSFLHTLHTFVFRPPQPKSLLSETKQQWVERRPPCPAPTVCLRRWGRLFGFIILLEARLQRWPRTPRGVTPWSSPCTKEGFGSPPPCQTVSSPSSLLLSRMRAATPASTKPILMKQRVPWFASPHTVNIHTSPKLSKRKRRKYFTSSHCDAPVACELYRNVIVCQTGSCYNKCDYNYF